MNVNSPRFSNKAETLSTEIVLNYSNGAFPFRAQNKEEPFAATCIKIAYTLAY